MIDTLITLSKVANDQELADAFRIRKKVFVEEQRVPEEEEYDAHEQHSTHFVAHDEEEQPCGTARWRETDKGIKLERFAVLPTHRGQGIGSMLLEAMLHDIQEDPNINQQAIYLHAQTPAIGFYEKFGFDVIGEEFEECGIKHYEMVR